jgi:hypothetical protein
MTASAMAAPDESVTVPKIVAVAPCAPKRVIPSPLTISTALTAQIEYRISSTPFFCGVILLELFTARLTGIPLPFTES